MGIMHKLNQLFANALGTEKIEVTFGIPLGVKFTISAEQFRAMQQANYEMTSALMFCFSDRDIMWCGIEDIDLDDAESALERVANDYRQHSDKIAYLKDAATSEYAEWLLSCIPDIADLHKKLGRQKSRSAVKSILAEELPIMRANVLPVIELLSALAPSSKGLPRVERCLSVARDRMTNEQRAASTPVFKKKSN